MEHKLGIIGYGNMGSWHAENVRDRVKGITVAGVYDINPERMALAVENGFKTYESAEALLASDIDIVLVATPNNYHKIYSIQALRAGKNVISEKPVCMSMQELDDVIAVSKETGKLFTVHQNRRFDTDFAIMKEIFDKKMIGAPRVLHSRLYSDHGISGDWRSSKEAGGGVLFDWGVHLIDQLVVLMGCDPVAVHAKLQNIFFKTVDDACTVTIDFANGATAIMTVDLWCYVQEARWQMYGTEGTCRIDKWFGTEGKMIRAETKEVKWLDGCVYTPNGLSRTMWPRPSQDIEEIALPVLDAEPRWEEFYENFMLACEGKAKQIVSHEEMRRTLGIVMAAFKSAETNEVVKDIL